MTCHILLATTADHIAQALHSALADSGHPVSEPLPGLLLAQVTNPDALFAAAASALSSTDAAQVRALVMTGQCGAELLSAMLDAPTLDQVARPGDQAEHEWLVLPGNDWQGDLGDVGRPDPARTDIDALMTRAVLLANVAVTIADARTPDMPLIYVNEAFERLSGYAASEVIGVNCRFLQSPGTDPAVLQQVRNAIAAGRDFTGVLRNRRKNGELWWNELRMCAVHDASGRLTHYFGFQQDVTAQIVAEAHVKYLARNEDLTGVADRPHLVEDLERVLTGAGSNRTDAAVLVIDVNGFQHVNDRIGVGGGDLALLATIMRLRGALRSEDLVERQHGDRFMAVLPGVPGQQTRLVAERAADAIRDSFRTPLDVADGRISLTASVGLAVFPEHGSTAQELVQMAERNLSAGRAGVVRGPG